jgi:hypothetical protein
MEVGQGPNWGCNAKGKKIAFKFTSYFLLTYNQLLKVLAQYNNDGENTKKFFDGTAPSH